MAHIASPLPAKRPTRASLRHIGIPDGRDVLAVYFSWVKQRYYRAQPDTGSLPSVPGSVRGTVGDLEPLPPALPVVKPSAEDPYAALDLMGMGGQFYGCKAGE